MEADYVSKLSRTARCLSCLFLLLLSSRTVDALYNRGSGVVDLNANNFDKNVKDSDGIWIVEFFAPWCGHCQSLAPEYKKAANVLKGIINVGAVDCDQQKALCGQYQIQGFPTIKIFDASGSSPESYNGERTAEGIVQAAQRAAQKLVQRRLGGSGSSSSKSGGGSGGLGDDVIELTESNFNNLVMSSDETWLVEFFAPWCGHCKNLKPHWARAATELKGKVKLGAVDATLYPNLAGKYGIQGYPTIKYFPAGLKRHPEEYDGGRTSEDIVNWALERHVANLPAPELVQAVTQEDLVNNCEKKPLCVIAFLPHILDCDSKCRNDYLDMLTKTGDKFKKQGWGWIWSEGGAQPNLEASLDVGGFGYPSMVVMSSKKMMFSLLKGSFSRDGIHEFLRDLSYGKGRTEPVKGAKMPQIRPSEPWDGKDGVLPEEEDMDFSDDDLDEEDNANKQEL